MDAVAGRAPPPQKTIAFGRGGACGEENPDNVVPGTYTTGRLHRILRSWEKYMGAEGYIRFYTARELEPESLISRTFDAVSAERLGMAWRTIGEDRSWERIKGFPELTEPLAAEGGAGVWLSSQLEGQPTKILPMGLGLADAPALYVPGTALTLFMRSKLSLTLDAIMRAAIPETIADGFVPSGLCMTVGWHDVFGSIAGEELHYFGRAFYSVGILGNGAPRDWKEYPRRALAVQELRELKRRTEIFAGPLEECVYWHA